MKSLLVIAILLVLAGLGLVLLPTPGAPTLACVESESGASPLVRPETGCAVTPASALAYQEWDAQPKWDNIGGLTLLLAGVGLGGTMLARRSRSTRREVRSPATSAATRTAATTPTDGRTQPAESDIGP